MTDLAIETHGEVDIMKIYSKYTLCSLLAVTLVVITLSSYFNLCSVDGPTWNNEAIVLTGDEGTNNKAVIENLGSLNNKEGLHDKILESHDEEVGLHNKQLVSHGQTTESRDKEVKSHDKVKQSMSHDQTSVSYDKEVELHDKQSTPHAHQTYASESHDEQMMSSGQTTEQTTVSSDQTFGSQIEQMMSHNQTTESSDQTIGSHDEQMMSLSQTTESFDETIGSHDEQMMSRSQTTESFDQTIRSHDSTLKSKQGTIYRFMEFDSCQEGTFLVVIIKSPVHELEARHAIRGTWGSVPYGRKWPYTVDTELITQFKLLFVIEIININDVNRALKNEHLQYKDLLWIDISVDNHISPWQYIQQQCKEVPFTMEVRTDTVVNIPAVLHLLENSLPRNEVYGTILKDYTTENYDIIDTAAYVTTTDLAMKLFLLSETPEHSNGLLTKAMITKCSGLFVELHDWMETPRPNVNCLFRNNEIFNIEKVKHVHQLFIFWKSIGSIVCS